MHQIHPPPLRVLCRMPSCTLDVAVRKGSLILSLELFEPTLNGEEDEVRAWAKQSTLCAIMILKKVFPYSCVAPHDYSVSLAQLFLHISPHL